MKIVKYVVKNDGVPLLFSPKITHSDVAKNSISAGFAIISYDLVNNKFIVKCYGYSSSLKIGVNETDFKIIQEYLNNLL